MTKQEYEAKLKTLHPQFDCDLIAKLKNDYISQLETKIGQLREQVGQLRDDNIQLMEQISNKEA